MKIFQECNGSVGVLTHAFQIAVIDLDAVVTGNGHQETVTTVHFMASNFATWRSSVREFMIA